MGKCKLCSSEIVAEMLTYWETPCMCGIKHNNNKGNYKPNQALFLLIKGGQITGTIQLPSGSFHKDRIKAAKHSNADWIAPVDKYLIEFWRKENRENIMMAHPNKKLKYNDYSEICVELDPKTLQTPIIYN